MFFDIGRRRVLIIVKYIILLTFIIMVWIQLVLALKRDNVIILIHQNEVYPIVHET